MNIFGTILGTTHTKKLGITNYAKLKKKVPVARAKSAILKKSCGLETKWFFVGVVWHACKRMCMIGETKETRFEIKWHSSPDLWHLPVTCWLTKSIKPSFACLVMICKSVLACYQTKTTCTRMM